MTRGRLLAWAMALRSHARRARDRMANPYQLAEDLVHLALEAEAMARDIPPEPAQIPDDGPDPDAEFDAAKTQPIELEPKDE